jgi:hypothetical protein
MTLKLILQKLNFNIIFFDLVGTETYQNLINSMLKFDYIGVDLKYKIWKIIIKITHQPTNSAKSTMWNLCYFLTKQQNDCIQ